MGLSERVGKWLNGEGRHGPPSFATVYRRLVGKTPPEDQPPAHAYFLAAHDKLTDWVWPFWVHRQADPEQPAYLPEPPADRLNATFRNWVTLTRPGSTAQARLDPRGLLTPWPQGWSLDVWVEYEGRLLLPSRQKYVLQRQIEGAPIIGTAFETDAYRLETEAFATSISKLDAVVLLTRLVNRLDRPLTAKIYLAVRPYNAEGLALLHTLRRVATDAMVLNERFGLQFTPAPEQMVFTEARQGDCLVHRNADEVPDATECPLGLASGLARFAVRCEPEGAATVAAAATLEPLALSSKQVGRLRRYDPVDARDNARRTWREQLQPGLRLVLPDKQVERAYTDAKSRLLVLGTAPTLSIDADRPSVFRFREAAYILQALLLAGRADLVRPHLETWPKRQQGNGAFEADQDSWEATAQAIWTAVQYLRLTDDRKLATDLFRVLEKGGDFLTRCRREGAGFAADTLHKKDDPAAAPFDARRARRWYWTDWWTQAAFEQLAWLAERLGQRSGWLRFEKEAESFGNALTRQVERTWPDLTPDDQAIAALCALAPLRLCSPRDPQWEKRLHRLESDLLDENGLVTVGEIGGAPLFALWLVHAHFLRRDRIAWAGLGRVCHAATQTGAWPAIIHMHTGGGLCGSGQHAWTSAAYALALRDALFFEDGDTLVLTGGTPADWCDWGALLEVHNAPTFFGEFAFRVEGFSSEVALDLAGAWRRTPRRIEWNLPFPVETALVDGRRVNVNDYRVVVPGGTSEVRVSRG